MNRARLWSRRGFHLSLRLSRRQLKTGLAGVLVIAVCGVVASETLTMVASFPSPIGIYNQLIATGKTILARDGGFVGVNKSSPTVTLDVDGQENVSGQVTVSSGIAASGPIQVGSMSSDPAASDGAMIFNTTTNNMQVHSSGYWHQLYADPVPQFYTNFGAVSAGNIISVACGAGSIMGGGCMWVNSSGSEITDPPPLGNSYPSSFCGQAWNCRAPNTTPAGSYLKAYAICTTPNGNYAPRRSIFCAVYPTAGLLTQ